MSEAQDDPALVAAQDYEKNVVTYTIGPFAAILLKHADPQPGERVVDVACGTGVVARQTAPRVGTAGTVVGVDINPAMLAVARSLPAPEGAPIDWREGSALALPLPDDAFDLALCQAGLQFFPDRLQALREMHRVLCSGGRVAISVWRSLEHHPVQQVLWEAIARHLNTTAAAIGRPFSLGDAGDLRTLLESAGFADGTIVARSYTVRQPRNPQRVTEIMMNWAGSIPTFATMNAEQRVALAQAIEHETAPALESYADGEEELYPAAAHIVLAHKL
jgi:SAM-dependent methyltransferase